MSNARQVLKQVTAAKKALNKLNCEIDLLPQSMRKQLKDLEMSLFVQQSKLSDIVDEEGPTIISVKKTA